MRALFFSSFLFLLPFFVSAQSGTPCHVYQSGSTPPAGYGAAWNTQTSARELLLSATCSQPGAPVSYTVGSGNANHYVYKVGYFYAASWKPFNMTGTFAQGSTDWLAGRGTYTNPSPPTADYFWVGYICQWNGTAWKCGCRDGACATNYWQLQGVKYPASGSTQRVTVIAFDGSTGANVRSCAGLTCTLLGTQLTGATGRVIGGPETADGVQYYHIDYTSGVDGWSATPYLQLSGGTTAGTGGIAAAYPGDQGISNHPAVLLHETFDAGQFSSSWTAKNHRNSLFTTASHHGARALQTTFPKSSGSVQGAQVFKKWDTGGDFEKLHIRWYQKWEAGFDDGPVGNHLGAFIVGCNTTCPPGDAGNPADGMNKFLISMEWRDDGTESAFAPPGNTRFYMYTLSGSNHYASPGAVPSLNAWHAMELMVKVNTVGSADGEIKGWIDGTLVSHKTGVRFRNISSLAIDKVGLIQYMHENSVRANTVWVDDIVIATDYIGPMAP